MNGKLQKQTSSHRKKPENSKIDLFKFSYQRSKKRKNDKNEESLRDLCDIIKRTKTISPPLALGNIFQNPQQVPETTYGTNHLHSVSSYAYDKIQFIN